MTVADMNNSPRCHAKSKRTGQQCGGRAVKGWKVCRCHGARGGAPKGNTNGLKHGRYSEAAKLERKAIRELLRAARMTLTTIGGGTRE